MYKHILLATLIIAFILPAHTVAGESDAPQSQVREMWGELNLTPEQEARFQAINARYAPARRDHNRLINDVRERINQELMKDRPSRSLLAQWAGEMGEYQKRLNIASVNHMLEVKGVLTPEQFQIFINNSTVGGERRRRRSE